MNAIIFDATIMPIGRAEHDGVAPGRRSVGRVVEVYRTRPSGKDKVVTGTGYLLDGGLVLTAAHVVRGGAKVEVLTGSQPEWLRCEVVWQRYDGPNRTGVDAALLRVVDPRFRPVSHPAMRWGRLVTMTGCPVGAIGFPAAMNLLRGRGVEYRDVAQIQGELMPGSRLKAGRYEVRVRTPVPPMGESERSRWSGMSGAALTAGDILLGVIAVDPDPGGGALTAVPVDALLADPEFRARVGGARTVPVELDDVFERPLSAVQSPIGLLRAELGTVRFHGRDDVVDRLGEWCESPEWFGVRLVTAPAGAGKTRLAVEVVERLRSAGWSAGFLAEDGPPGRFDVLAALTEPLLLVVDYAETRGDQVRSLVRALERGGGTPPVRLLLLARGEGEWWGGLRSTTRLLRTPPAGTAVRLPDLEPDGPRRREAFREAVGDLHAALADLPGYEVAPDFDPDQVPPPPLRGTKHARALAVQMAALAALLQHLSPIAGVSGEPAEEVLLLHESHFWGAAVSPHRLDHLHSTTLRLLVAVATLCPVAGHGDAVALLGHLSLLRGETSNTLAAVATWLHELYASDTGYWSPLVPDALGEYLVGSLGERSAVLLDDLAGCVDQMQAEQVLTVLSRARERFPALTDAIVRYVMGRPRPFAFAAITVVVQGSHPALGLALDRLVAVSNVETTLVEDLLAAVPRRTLTLAAWAVRLSAWLVDLVEQEAADDEQGLLARAEARREHSFRQYGQGLHTEALVHAVEAVRLSEYAAERFAAEPDDLVRSLLCWAARLAGVNRRRDAVAAAGKAVSLCHELDRERGGQPEREQLALALHHQAMWLRDIGEHHAAERAGSWAVAIRTRLAPRSSRHRAGLAASRLNHAIYLQDLGRPRDGLRHARRAVDAYRSLAEDAPDAHLVDLGRALLNLARLLAALGDLDDALGCARETVAVYRQFVQEDMVDPRVELAIALANHGRRAAACSRTPEAIAAFEEAEDLLDDLASGGSAAAAAGRLATVRRDLLVLRGQRDGHPGDR